MTEISVINGVRIEHDTETGTDRFFPVETEKQQTAVCKNEKTAFEKFTDWWNGLFVKPYANVRDLNNDENTNYENKPVPAAEIGIRIDF